MTTATGKVPFGKFRAVGLLGARVLRRYCNAQCAVQCCIHCTGTCTGMQHYSTFSKENQNSAL